MGTTMPVRASAARISCSTRLAHRSPTKHPSPDSRGFRRRSSPVFPVTAAFCILIAPMLCIRFSSKHTIVRRQISRFSSRWRVLDFLPSTAQFKTKSSQLTGVIKMNRKNIAIALIAAVASLGAVASNAAENANNYPDVASQGQPLTRAAVLADLAQARANGLIPQGDADYPVYVASGASKTRVEVKTELAQARAEGLLAENDTDYPVAAVAQSSNVSRADVKQELARARAAGQLDEFQGS
ncbi:hypothetical protein DBA20_13965 [Pandoraea capi]|nr:hypothetical protein [Pandoraea sp. LA3]MDN4584090.1 hypothetical protein [Pandoraea capi]